MQPYYSLADLYRDINNGVVNQFKYNDQLFFVKRSNFNWYVTHEQSNTTAIAKHYIGCMTDLQGLAASLLYYKHSIEFNKAGELVRSMYFIYPVENNLPVYSAGHSAQLEALTAIEALQQWYNHINSLAGDFKNTTYHAQQIPNC